MAATGHGTLTIYTKVDDSGLKKGLKGITKSVNQITGLLSFTAGIAGMIALGKSAIDAASDLQEYRNVAEVTFGELIYKLDELNKVAIESYGMSELMATQAASGFMAMGNAAGIAKDEAADMAIELTKYTADFASFYNLSFERARTALAAVYTGETETLKQYGIMLQEVNLQQFENEQGLGRSVKTMSAAEKAQLRYNYIMHVGVMAQGDFARTSDNWANQVRVLQERWKQFLITLGSGLITVLTPLLQILNILVQRTIEYANIIGAALTKIFGIKWQDITEQQAALSGSAGDAADAENDLADATNKAAKAASKALQPFDKLNVIKEDSSKNSGGGGLSVDTSGLEDVPSALDQVEDKIQSTIDSLYELGEYVGETIQNVLGRIDWPKVYEGARNFGKGLADFLNGLISPELFSSVAKTIAGALNTALYAISSFGTTFDWTDFGKSIGEGINKFFSTFDFKELANTINTWVQGIWTALTTALDTVDWSLVYSKIKEFLSNVDIDTVGIIIKLLVIKKILGLVLSGSVFKWIGTAISGALFAKTLKVGLGKIVVTLAKGGLIETGDVLGRIIDAFALWKGGAGTLSESFAVMFPKIAAGITKLGTAISKFGAGIASFFSKIGGWIAGLGAGTIGGILSIVTGAVTAIWSFITMLIDGFSWLKEILMVIGVALAAVGAVILGAPALITAAIAAIVAAVMTAVVFIVQEWESIVKFFKKLCKSIGDFFVDLWDGIKNVWNTVCDWFKTKIIDPIGKFFSDLWEGIKGVWSTVATWFDENVIQPVVNFFVGLFTRIGQVLEGVWIIIQAVWIIVSEWFNTWVIQPIVNFFKWLWETVSGFFVSLWEDIVAIWNTVSTWFNENVIIPVVNFFKGLWESISTFFKNLWEDIKRIWNAVATWFDTWVIQPVVKFFKGVWTSVSGFFKNLWDDIKRVWNSVATWFNDKIITPVKNAFKVACDAIAGFFSNLWSGIKRGIVGAMNAVIGGIESAINFIVGGINKIIGGFNKVVSWAAKIAEVDWGGVDLVPKVSISRIPQLAKGAVIPPNKEFLAILGDQRHGTNIEAPLNTIKQAVAEVLAQRGTGDSGDIIIQIDGNEVFRVVRRKDREYANRTGSSAFAY